MQAILTALIMPLVFANIDPDWAARKSKALVTSCREGFGAFDKQYAAAEKEFFQRMKGVTAGQLREAAAKSASAHSNAFLNLARELWPQYLPEDYPGRLSYIDCAVDLRHLHIEGLRADNKTLAREKFENWRDCLRESYRNDIPPLSRELLGCYEQLLGK